jgi:hypothetical protein
MKPNHVKLTGLAAALILTTACLKSDVTETWYVDGSGSVTWVIHEENVRSDAQSPIDQRSEENEYWLAVQQDRHAMAEGLRELRGEKLRTLVLRAEAPYTVRTEAKFTSLDVLGQRLIAATGTTGTSIVRRDANGWEWTLVVRDPSSLQGAGEPSDAMTSLLDGLEHLKIVLVTGRFDEATGFELSSDRRVATLSLREEILSDRPEVTLKLSWK